MRQRVAEARVGRLATIDSDGRAAMVPFGFVLDGQTLFSSVDQKPKSTTRLRRLDNIRRDPRVTVLVDHYEDDWSRLWWVRLRGRGRVIDRGPERDRAVGLLVEKYPQYRDSPPSGPVIAIEVDEWRGWQSVQ
jgi:PPOX class probable F420-dependent enzyme